MKFLFLSLMMALSSFAFAQGIVLQEEYMSGPELYKSIVEQPGLTIDLRGKFVQAPLDYKNPSRGTIQIYYRVSKNFNPAQPTVLYFYGGPGGNSWFSQFETSLPDVNFIYMDQRGTGFSKPAQLVELQTTDYFSSEYIARDADLVRAAVGVDKVTSYGHSYGTVVANIYASLFRDHTSSMILEGTIFDGTEQLWTNPHRLKLLNRFFARLPKDQQTKILDFTQRPDVPDEWLGILAQQLMYMPNFEKNLTTQLNNYIDNYDKAEHSPDQDPFMSESRYFGAYMFNHIACKELSREAEHANFASTLTPEGKFVPYTGNGAATCKTLIGFDESKVKTYHATAYPVTAPTTYFQGTEDGSTGATNAIHHYKYATIRNAQLILVTHEGHMPMISCVSQFVADPSAPKPVCKPEYVSMFKSAIRGERITKEQLKAATTPDNKWVMTARWK